ncbi:hypothetical protein Tsubulata_015713 [Turnera subulata]|uniref:Uncharacterized protein n=1 Tax=Turnera subulata TaxID=218843 RepID=A0A9Q0FDG2_9ROSI|nr:hypothetical protein Tsubulata_015713 [Turnera subulata]
MHVQYKHPKPRPLSLRDQIRQFSTVRDTITAELGREEAARLLSQALFIVSDGGNDFAEYIRNLTAPIQWPSQFLRDLASTYQVHFQDLYNLGARKFGIVGIPPIGSTPVTRANLGFLGQYIVNLASQRFYDDTKKFMEDFKLEGMHYSLGNAIAFTNDVIRLPWLYGN